MSPRKLISAFLLKIVVIYALLWVPWPGVQRGYAGLFCYAGNLAFHVFGSAGRTRFRVLDPSPANKNAVDWEIKLENIRTRAGGTFEQDRSTRKMGYLPAAFTASLVLATPIPWRRRLAAMVWAMPLITAFVGLQLTLRLVDAFSNPDVFNQFELGLWTKRLLGILLKVVVMSPVTAFIAPVFVWILVTFRRTDWATLLPSPGSSAKHEPPSLSTPLRGCPS
ncbi:MAG: hypothetical protein V1790_04930 [Planctomycetota bacterium]